MTVPFKRRPRPLMAAAAPLLALASAAGAAPCNPVIDGTYCAEQMPRSGVTPPLRPTMSPIQDLGSAISGTPTSPATLGGISFRGGGSTCIGLLRRGACN